MPALPHHVAIIMDGNGRWAQSQGRHRIEGHREGARAVRRIVRASRKMGIKSLTLYAFSEQNWRRPQPEVIALMGLLHRYLASERQELLDNGIRLRAIGRTDRLPGHVRRALDRLARDTETQDGMTLTLALSYGGREEMADAARELAERVGRGELAASEIDEALVGACLPSVAVGEVDLLIRTSGEKRLSNFLLWGAAYAELYFIDKHWPEMDEADLEGAVAAFARRERRFGRVVEPDAPTPALRTAV